MSYQIPLATLILSSFSICALGLKS